MANSRSKSRGKKRRMAGKKVRRPLVGSSRLRARLLLANKWPLLECLITADWQQPGQLIQIAVVRQSPNTGEIALGVFLIDLGCLGVKNSWATIFTSQAQYRRDYRVSLTQSQTMTKCDVDTAAKVIDEAVKYADSMGFRPPRNYRDAKLLIGDANPEKSDAEVPLGGEDGKPLYISGPYDDPDRVRRILDRKVGPGNYDFVVAIGPPDFWDDDFRFDGQSGPVDD